MSDAASASAFPARLIVVADRDYVADDERWLALIAEIAAHTAGHPVAIQVRMKGASRARAGVLAARVREIVPRAVPLLLNGEAALAARLGYSGVHWPEDDIPAAPPPHPLAFRSAAVHSVAAARRAERAGADLAVFGAVYAPGSKPGTSVGVEALNAVTRVTSLPIFAIGGIHPQHVAECLSAGAYGVAVVSGILGAPDVPAAVDRYCEVLAMYAVPAAFPVQEGGFR